MHKNLQLKQNLQAMSRITYKIYKLSTIKTGQVHVRMRACVLNVVCALSSGPNRCSGVGGAL